MVSVVVSVALAGRAIQPPSTGVTVLRLTRFVLNHRMLVVLLWVALAVAGAATAHTTTSRLSTSFTFPGQAG